MSKNKILSALLKGQEVIEVCSCAAHLGEFVLNNNKTSYSYRDYKSCDCPNEGHIIIKSKKS